MDIHVLKEDLLNDVPAFYATEGLNVETYDVRMRLEGTPVEGDVAFFLDEAAKRGGPILELGSGTGRVTWPLAESGFEVVGLDRSVPMRQRAVAKGEAYPDQVRKRTHFIHGDMREFDLKYRFAFVIIPFRAFQSILTPVEQRRCLTCIREHLAPGGGLVIDQFDPRLEWCVPGASPPMQRDDTVHPDTGNLVKVRITGRTNDPVTQIFTETWSFAEVTPDGQTLREDLERLQLRWTYRQEARYLFELTGFDIQAEFSDFHRTPQHYGRDQVWVLVRR